MCPDCLREEFAAATPRAVDSVRRANEASMRRQAARAARMSGGFQSGTAFSAYGKLRFALGLVIFLICAFIFMVGAAPHGENTYSLLPVESQRPVSIIFCWVAAVLVLTSTRRYKALIYPLVLFFVAAGWFMPTFWKSLADGQKKIAADAVAASEVKSAADEGEKKGGYGHELTESDLAIFREKKQVKGNNVHFAIYISTRDVYLRQDLRDAIARLLEADSCEAFTRGQGSLFIVSGAAGGVRNISSTAARFGDLNYAGPAEGIYEVAFIPDKVNAVSRFTTEMLTTPSNPSFVSANIAELRCLLAPHRVRAAAVALKDANVQVLRRDIYDTLVEVLRDPWLTEPDTYEALVEAMVAYAPHGEKSAVELARKYFRSCRVNQRKPSAAVLELLIREVPDEMVAPVVDLWVANPVEWEGILSQLGERPQKRLLELLESTDSLQLIGTILKHLETHGTQEAMPVVKKFLDHEDSLISRTAKATQRALMLQSF